MAKSIRTVKEARAALLDNTPFFVAGKRVCPCHIEMAYENAKGIPVFDMASGKTHIGQPTMQHDSSRLLLEAIDFVKYPGRSEALPVLAPRPNTVFVRDASAAPAGANEFPVVYGSTAEATLADGGEVVEFENHPTAYATGGSSDLPVTVNGRGEWAISALLEIDNGSGGRTLFDIWPFAIYTGTGNFRLKVDGSTRQPGHVSNYLGWAVVSYFRQTEKLTGRISYANGKTVELTKSIDPQDSFTPDDLTMRGVRIAYCRLDLDISPDRVEQIETALFDLL